MYVCRYNICVGISMYVYITFLSFVIARVSVPVFVSVCFLVPSCARIRAQCLLRISLLSPIRSIWLCACVRFVVTVNS